MFHVSRGVKVCPRMRWVPHPHCHPHAPWFSSTQLFFLWIICHLSGQLTVCPFVVFSFYFMSVCLALGPGAIESNYNICEEGNSRGSLRDGKLCWKCVKIVKMRLTNGWAIFMLSSDPNQVGQLKAEIHIATVINYWQLDMRAAATWAYPVNGFSWF